MKKILPDKKYIFIAIAALAIALGPFAAKTASAWLPSIFPSVEDLAASLGNLVLWLVSWVLWLTANLFEYTLKLTLENSTFTKITVINLGWSIVRDVVNLFFIFILLYIAIGAILRLAGHDAKKLLVNLILAALLINFSLVITKVIIDASNILALEFYNNIKGENGVTQTMMNGLKLASIYNSDVLKVSLQAPNPEKAAVANIILGTLGGSALILITAFVFLAATFLFIARTIVLMFLMILSPLAFGAMILPQTKKHADRWWQELTCQCLLAPAFMFMIYLVVTIINEKDFGSAISGIGADPSASIASTLTGGIERAIGVILNFVLLIGLMIGSLIISKNLACAGGAQALAAAGWARGKVQGYAKSYAKRGAGWMAEREMKKEIEEKGGKGSWAGTIMKGVRKFPGVDRGLAALSAGRERELAAKQQQYKKQYGSYSEAGLQTMLESPIITSEKRKAIGNIQKERLAKKEAEADRKKTEAKEKEKYKEIVGGEETVKDEKTGEPIKITTRGKLGEINEQLNKIMKEKSQDINAYLDNLEAQLENLRGDSSPGASTKRESIIFDRGKINRLTKEKEKLETRKEKLEEKQQSEAEKKKIEERLGKIEEKPTEEKPKETKL